MSLFLFQPGPTGETEFSQLFGKRLVRLSPAIHLLRERTVRVETKQNAVDVGRRVLAALSQSVSLTVFIAACDEFLLQWAVFESR